MLRYFLGEPRIKVTQADVDKALKCIDEADVPYPHRITIKHVIERMWIQLK